MESKEKDLRPTAVQREYDDLASLYDKKWRKYIYESTRRTVEKVDLTAYSRILDIGCGTGELLRFLHSREPKARLIGLDTSSKMIEIAREKLGKQVELRIGVSENLPFENNSFDSIVTSSSFHYWRDPEKSLSEVRRVLKPNGAFILTDWCDDFWMCKVCDFVFRIFNGAHFRTYGLKECELLLRDSGFLETQSEKYKIGLLWGMMTVSAKTT